MERLSSPWKRALPNNTSKKTTKFYTCVGYKDRRLCLKRSLFLRLVQICAVCGSVHPPRHGSVVCSVGPQSGQLHADGLASQTSPSWPFQSKRFLRPLCENILVER